MNERSNKMELLGSAPIPRALMALGVPIMTGMLINALYNLVDAYFVGGLGESPMGAISIVFPLGQVMVGLGLMFGNGAASCLSRLLGKGDRDTADRVASTALYSSVMIGGIQLRSEKYRPPAGGNQNLRFMVVGFLCGGGGVDGTVFHADHITVCRGEQ